ncbi:MAG: MFS transporter [Planctomycetaceae bacterium]
MQTKVRYHVIAATTVAAVILYLDRICMGEIAKLDSFQHALSLTDGQKGAILSAFFFSYALAQVPAGWLSDRFGARKMLPFYIAVWSLCTIMTGLANSFLMLLVARLLFGLAQAGCYPTAGSLIKRWMPLSQRGTASSVVSVGGRLGGALAPVLTTWLVTTKLLPFQLDWREVLGLYGIVGFAVAIYFWWICRESPAEHPACNGAEREYVTAEDVEATESGPPKLPPVLSLLCSGTMWLMCVLQFGINVGWVFLITWLPTYLKKVKGVDDNTGGLMSTIILTSGIVGMLLGGPLTDIAKRFLGRRWGRSAPAAACYVFAVLAYLSCLYLQSAWHFVIAASLVAFFTDLSVPAIWAYMQDVGGKNTAAVFGWGNMWGNLGGAAIAQLIPYALKNWDSNGDWHEVFLLLALGYLFAFIAALGINANKKIE